MNRAALIMGALSGLLGGYQGARKEARERAMDERKLALQEAALEQKTPSSGVANLQFLRQMYPDQEVSRDEALRLLSPAGFGPAPIPGELAAFMSNPSGVKNYLDTKARAGKATYDFGDDEEGDPNSSQRDEPTSPRPAIRAPGARPAVEMSSPVPESPIPAAAPSPATPPSPKGGASVRKKFNPATGQLEPVVEKVNFNDLSIED